MISEVNAARISRLELDAVSSTDLDHMHEREAMEQCIEASAALVSKLSFRHWL